VNTIEFKTTGSKTAIYTEPIIWQVDRLVVERRSSPSYESAYGGLRRSVLLSPVVIHLIGEYARVINQVTDLERIEHVSCRESNPVPPDIESVCCNHYASLPVQPS